jgi:putative transposase
VACVNRWAGKTGRAVLSFWRWTGRATSKGPNGKSRSGKANEPNAWVPRDHGLDEAEETAMANFPAEHPPEGDRRLTVLRPDADVVAARPSSGYRALKRAGVLEGHRLQPSTTGKGFVQPLLPPEHGPVDVSYLNVAGAFEYPWSIRDGGRRHIVPGEIRETMTEAGVPTLGQRGRETCPGGRRGSSRTRGRRCSPRTSRRSSGSAA